MIRCRGFVLITLLLFTGLGTVSAQERGQNSNNAGSKGGSLPGMKVAVYDITVPSIPLETLVDVIRKKDPSSNIVLDEQAGNVILPTFSLKGVTTAELIDVVHVLQPKVIRIRAENGIYIIGYNQPRQTNRSSPVAQVLTVPFTIRELTTGMAAAKQKEILSAIKMGLEMSGARKEITKIQIHEETGLLFVKGTKDTVRLVDQIINEIRSSNDQLRRTMPLGRVRPGNRQEKTPTKEKKR